MADQSSIYCPSCNKHTSLTALTSLERHGLRYEIGECNSCNQMFLVQRQTNGYLLETFPNQLPKPIDEKTPEFLIKDLKEAYDCFSVSAYRATAVLARRALQKCCIEKGAPDKKLIEQVQWLLDNQIITKDLKEWAEEVRLTGNDCAHPPKKIEEEMIVPKDDAEDILLLLEKFVDVLYIAPQIAQERRDAREQK